MFSGVGCKDTHKYIKKNKTMMRSGAFLVDTSITLLFYENEKLYCVNCYYFQLSKAEADGCLDNNDTLTMK